MNYQNYEEYLRSVLGYVPNTYYGDNNQNYMSQQIEGKIEEKTELYPEIYKIVYPMVQKACDETKSNDITNDLIENITNIVYTNLEVGDINVTGNQSIQPELRNGDVINPRARQRETRGGIPSNPILRDLIRILVLREFFDRKPPRPNFPGRPEPRPPFGNGLKQPPRVY